MSQLCIQINTIYFGPAAVPALFYLISILVLTDIFEHKYMM